MAMNSNRPSRFGESSAPSPASVAAKTVTSDAPTLAPVPEPEETSAPGKKSTPAKKTARNASTPDLEVLRKSVEWTSEVEAMFQDGADDWYSDRSKRERKRRLGRRPSDNKLITALVLLGLEAINENDKYNERLEELLPADGRRRTS